MYALDQNRSWSAYLIPVGVLVAFIPFFAALVRESARNPYAGHVVFVPILSVVIVAVERSRFRGLAGCTPGALPVVGGALGLLGIGYAADNLKLQALCLVAAAAGTMAWHFGRRGLRRAAFALGFLLLSIPPPADAVGAVAPAVQQFVAVFSEVVVQAIGVPVGRDGILLHLPSVTLEVAEQCAGLRFLPILVVFGAAFARIVVPEPTGQLTLMALCVPMAIIANATRVAATTAGAYFFGSYVATGRLHFYIGKAFWLLALVSIVGLALRLRDRGHLSLRQGVMISPAP